MIRRCFVALAAALLAAGVTATSAAASPAAPAGPAQDPPGRVERAAEPVSGHYIVTLHDTPPARVATAARSLAADHGARVTRTYTDALHGFAAEMTEAEASALSRDPAVAHVEQDGVVHVVDTQTNPPWGLDRIDQRNRPLDQRYTYEPTGAGVRAYIIDTGIRVSHRDFEGRASHGRDTVDNDNDATDCNGHGTHVAGTVGGATHGVAKDVSLVAVRVLNCQGSGTTSGVIAGIDWVTANAQRPATANMSLGGGASTALDTAVRNSIASGITYAVAAGNGDALGRPQNACNGSPSRVTEAVVVSATNSSDAKASWANTGSCVDIFAPGVSIASAWHTSDTATNTISGTSMATPHVAGAAALYLQTSPGASPASVASALTTNATTGVVSGPGSGSPNRLLYTGFIGGDPDPDPDPDPGPDPDPSTPTLTDGVPATATNGATGTWRYFKIQVPAGAPSLSVVLDGTCTGWWTCSPDLDLFVRQGARPTTSAFACRSQSPDATESCTVSAPAAGWWYVGVYVYGGGGTRISYTMTADH